MLRFDFDHKDSRSSRSFSGCHPVNLLIVCVLAVLVVGCRSTMAPAESADNAPPLASNTSNVVDTASAAGAASTEQDLTPTDGMTTTTPVSGTDTISGSASFLPPIRLAIPALDFATAVEPMAWQVTEVDGQRQAVWQVPETDAGWHINSAGVGAPDNMIISGHHRQGAAVFAPLARGEVALDDEIYVTDEGGRTFVYQVSEIAAPIPVVGATEAERERLNAYQAPSTEGKLTLLTGWPDFSDTHYLVIVARLVRKLE